MYKIFFTVKLKKKFLLVQSMKNIGTDVADASVNLLSAKMAIFRLAWQPGIPDHVY